MNIVWINLSHICANPKASRVVKLFSKQLQHCGPRTGCCSLIITDSLSSWINQFLIYAIKLCYFIGLTWLCEAMLCIPITDKLPICFPSPHFSHHSGTLFGGNMRIRIAMANQHAGLNWLFFLRLWLIRQWGEWPVETDGHHHVGCIYAHQIQGTETTKAVANDGYL